MDKLKCIAVGLVCIVVTGIITCIIHDKCNDEEIDTWYFGD